MRTLREKKSYIGSGRFCSLEKFTNTGVQKCKNAHIVNYKSLDMFFLQKFILNCTQDYFFSYFFDNV